MAEQDRFRPYIGLPSEQERLQALRDFLQWIYQVYTLRDLFSRDLHMVLSGLGVSEGVVWGREKLVTYVEGQDMKWCQELQRQVREASEKLLHAFKKKESFTLYSYSRSLEVREAGSGKAFLNCVYDPMGEPNLQTLQALILLKLSDVLHGLNLAALVECALCGHYTVRRHPRGKEYCSPTCRWKAVAAARREAAKKLKTEKKRQPVSRRARKEN